MQVKLSGIILIGLFMLGLFHIYQPQPLNEGVLRLHVVANSDSPMDQALKLEVKDQVVKAMQPEFSQLNDAASARQAAIDNIPHIRQVARDTIRSRGYDYPVKVSVGEYQFPTKSYGNLVFPQGEYQAVRVIIGQGNGQNWWCVLFPPLCMVSSSEKGLSLDSPREATVSFKCLELLPRGLKLGKFDRQKD